MMNLLEKCPLVLILCAGMLCAAPRSWAQTPDADPPDSSSQAPSPAPAPVPPPAPASAQDDSKAPENRVVTWRSLPKDFLHDQKDIWLFPVRLAEGRHWVPTLAVAGVTTGLVYADPHVMPYFRDHARNLDKLNDTFDAPITTAEVAAVPTALLMYGYFRHDEYARNTALLAGEAYADSAIVDLAIKAVTRRKRPNEVPPGGDFRDTFFSGGKSPFRGSAFPSGHAAGVFSVATVVAARYRSHRWVPWVMYGFATVISFARVTDSSHFPSDVFLGAALGYSITRFEVLRPHDRQ